MNADDELCLCFHVSWRKVINYVRVHKIRVASQVAECAGAGTGCGWCRKQITRIVEDLGTGQGEFNEQSATAEKWLALLEVNADDYARARDAYRESSKSNSGS